MSTKINVWGGGGMVREGQNRFIMAKYTWEQIFRGGNVCYKKGWGFATLNKNLIKQKLYLVT